MAGKRHSYVTRQLCKSLGDGQNRSDEMSSAAIVGPAVPTVPRVEQQDAVTDSARADLRTGLLAMAQDVMTTTVDAIRVSVDTTMRTGLSEHTVQQRAEMATLVNQCTDTVCRVTEEQLRNAAQQVALAAEPA